MPIKALVIDLDGTLYSSEKLAAAESACIPRTHSYLHNRGLLEKISSRQMLKIDNEMKQGLVSSNIMKLSKRFGLDYDHFDSYVNDLNPTDFGIVTDRKLMELLSEASKCYKLFVFTNAPQVWAKRAVSCIGIKRLIPFMNVIHIERLKGYMKPDPKAYKIMLKAVRMKADEILFLDDMQDNIKEARKLGIKSILVSNTNRNKRNSVYITLEHICRMQDELQR